MRREVAVDLPPLRNSPRVSAGSAALNVVTGNNDVNDNNDASVYIPVRTVGQRHGPCVGHGVRSSYAAWRPPAPAWRPMIRAFSGRCPGVSVTIRAAFASRDVVDMVRTGAAELGLFVTPGPRTDKKVIAHAAGEQRFVATTTSHSYPATASASLTPPCTRERRRRVQRDRRPAQPGLPRGKGRTGGGVHPCRCDPRPRLRLRAGRRARRRPPAGGLGPAAHRRAGREVRARPGARVRLDVRPRPRGSATTTEFTEKLLELL